MPSLVTYRLSNRQQKELLIRGQQLKIALPIDDEPDNPVAMAKQLLPEHAEYVIAAEIANVRVGQCRQNSGGVVDLLGIIDPPRDDLINYWISAIVVTLQHGRLRGEVQLQWPGVAIFPNGYSYPPPKDA